MANYLYTNNNIQFQINDDAGWTGLLSKYGHNGNNWSKINSGERNTIKPFVNAVEIDWNGAVRYLPFYK